MRLLCSQVTHLAVVRQLQTERAALKAEVVELRAAIVAVNTTAEDRVAALTSEV